MTSHYFVMSLVPILCTLFGFVCFCCCCCCWFCLFLNLLHPGTWLARSLYTVSACRQAYQTSLMQVVEGKQHDYVVTWNVKKYVSHPLKCRMCQKWLKWCSDPPPPTTTPKLQLDFLDLENFLVKVWGGGGGVSGARPPPPPPLNSTCFTYKYYI